MSDNQILSVAQMQAAEQALMDNGISVHELMQRAGRGAAEWVWRISGGRSVTVLCGPGNNGGDGYVIAQALRERGGTVKVIAPLEPKTDAAKRAREKWGGPVATSGSEGSGGVFVDCLFGSGLSRALSAEHVLLIRDLASRHSASVAVDLPSGVESDSGALLNERLPLYDVTLALGAWKFAHWSLPAREKMGVKRLVPIGVGAVDEAARLIGRTKLHRPSSTDHKYTRGLAAIIAGEMPGAATLAATSAQRAGAGYVKLLAEGQMSLDPSLVCDGRPLHDALDDERIAALLIGSGYGRSDASASDLALALERGEPTVLDADALHLIKPDSAREGAQVLATPHDGELSAMCKSFAVIAEGRRARALALAKVSGFVICAKGPDTVIAAPDGRLAISPPAPSWLSVAGSGDVLAGIAVSRMASGRDPFTAACEAVWLHGEAARQAGVAFTAAELAEHVSGAFEACL